MTNYVQYNCMRNMHFCTYKPDIHVIYRLYNASGVIKCIIYRRTINLRKIICATSECVVLVKRC